MKTRFFAWHDETGHVHQIIGTSTGESPDPPDGLLCTPVDGQNCRIRKCEGGYESFMPDQLGVKKQHAESVAALRLRAARQDAVRAEVERLALQSTDVQSMINQAERRCSEIIDRIEACTCEEDIDAVIKDLTP